MSEGEEACVETLRWPPTELVASLSSSLNGATDIQEFPDLKGTTSLEIL